MEQSERTCLVSVIMPAYQAERYIGDAIASVMAQTIPDWELWVMIDGSTDRTSQIAQEMAQQDCRIHVVCNAENLGTAGSRNRGMDLCGGAYVAFLDSDDLWHPRKLEKQLEHLQRTGGHFSYTSYSVIDENGQKLGADYLVPPTRTFDEMLGENVIGCSTVLLCPEIARKYRFSTAYYHEDYVLWTTLIQAGYRAVGCQEVLTSWRLSANSRSFNKSNAAKNRWHIYRDCLHLSLPKACLAFVRYALAGLRKYRR